MRKAYEGNEDWAARDQGRVPTKGAKAAERASAGLGTTDYDAAYSAELLPPRIPVKRVPRRSGSGKP